MIAKSGKFLGLFAASWMSFAALADEKPGEPSRWLLKDHDTTIHMMGTIHALPDGVRWLSRETRDALYGSDTLVLEIPPAKLIGGSYLSMNDYYKYFLPRYTYLDDVLDEELYARVADRMDFIGLHVNIWGRLQPWVIANLVTASYNLDSDFEFLNGVEISLMKLVEEEFKNVIGLEDANAGNQAQLMMAEEDGAEAIRLAFKEGKEWEDWGERLVEAWKQGDDVALAAMQDEMESQRTFKKYNKALLEDRNRAWVKAIRKMMHFKGTYFIAVGAAHMTGENNLVQLLAEEGMVAERMAGTGPSYSAPEEAAEMEEPAAGEATEAPEGAEAGLED